jgi:hypothetical protein
MARLQLSRIGFPPAPGLRLKNHFGWSVFSSLMITYCVRVLFAVRRSTTGRRAVSPVAYLDVAVPFKVLHLKLPERVFVPARIVAGKSCPSRDARFSLKLCFSPLPDFPLQIGGGELPKSRRLQLSIERPYFHGLRRENDTA